ncbi:hypothetical protein FQN55_005728 [Onygenales sp. PD_40]|nr:hypothetical protein FQN55_005728 [Onygenales sp. PD_40]
MSNDQHIPETSQGLAMDNAAAAGSAADKKRNKLGYHRTSVACGRCENCIRLKKECHFFPVDQQPPVDKRSRAGSKTGTTSTEASITSSPPALGSAGIMDQKDSYFPYPPVPLNSGQDISPYEPGPFAGTPMSTFSPDALNTQDFNAVPPPNQPVSWEGASYFDQQMPSGMPKPQMSDATNALWTQGAPVAPLPSASSIPGTPLTPGGLPPTAEAAAFGMQDNSAWGIQQTRSMTLASGELAQYQNQYQQPLPQQFKRRMTTPADGYVHAASSAVPELPSSTIPVSYTHSQPAAAYPSWDAFPGQPAMVPNPGSQQMVGATPDGLGGWLPADPIQYAQMKQEEANALALSQSMHPP